MHIKPVGPGLSQVSNSPFLNTLPPNIPSLMPSNGKNLHPSKQSFAHSACWLQSSSIMRKRSEKSWNINLISAMFPWIACLYLLPCGHRYYNGVTTPGLFLIHQCFWWADNSSLTKSLGVLNLYSLTFYVLSCALLRCCPLEKAQACRW